MSGLRFQYTPCHSERSEESAFLAVETGLAPSPSRVSTQSSYCTVSVTATCFVIGDAPDDVAVTVTVLEPSGVPTVGGLPPPLGGLAAVPQPVDQIVDSVSKQIRPLSVPPHEHNAHETGQQERVEQRGTSEQVFQPGGRRGLNGERRTRRRSIGGQTGRTKTASRLLGQSRAAEGNGWAEAACRRGTDRQCQLAALAAL